MDVSGVSNCNQLTAAFFVFAGQAVLDPVAFVGGEYARAVVAGEFSIWITLWKSKRLEINLKIVFETRDN